MKTHQQNWVKVLQMLLKPLNFMFLKMWLNLGKGNIPPICPDS